MKVLDAQGRAVALFEVVGSHVPSARATVHVSYAEISDAGDAVETWNEIREDVGHVTNRALVHAVLRETPAMQRRTTAPADDRRDLRSSLTRLIANATALLALLVEMDKKNG